MADGDETSVGFDVAEMATQDAYRILINSVAPRPIAFVSTLSSEGRPNLAPFSFFMAGGANPPSVAFSPTNDRANRPKDTLINVRDTGEYVINIVTYAMREPMNTTAAEYPYGVSEWEEAGFTPAPSAKVRPARVLESPFALECRLHQIVTHGPGPTSANYVIGEVVYFHVAARLLDDGVIDARRVDYIARLGADWYARANADALFSMPRPIRPSTE